MRASRDSKDKARILVKFIISNLINDTNMNRREFIRLAAAGAASMSLRLSAFTTKNTKNKPNILFIAVDDLNDWIGCLGGHPDVQTPNIDWLARKGVLFTNAHCCAPACNPSRTGIFTGLLPSTTGVYLNPQPFRKALPDTVTLTEYFMKHGYYAMGCGKLYHHKEEIPRSWHDYQRIQLNTKPKDRPNDWRLDGGPMDISDDEMGDGKVANWAVEQLKKKYDRPFFLGVGIFRPHLDWFVPRKYFEMYPPEKIKLPIVNEDDLDDIPPIGKEIAECIDDHHTVKKYKQWGKAVAAYLACVSFADAMIGRVLDALQKSPYADNTVIVLWGDHGWHLGEKLHWRKFTLWEEATRCPFIIVAPGITKPGSTCQRPVSLVDIYPTLLDICGLAPKDGLDGKSLSPLLKNPKAPWDRPALTTYGRNNHSLRSERWRYIRYADGTEELYDHENDKLEWYNLADKPQYAEIKEQMARWLPKINTSNASDANGNTDVKLWHIRFRHLRHRKIQFQ